MSKEINKPSSDLKSDVGTFFTLNNINKEGNEVNIMP